ncbi:MAG: ParB/RepB/Spo0J family partition protein [Patescibacteria group bacterium]|nr:ParB/RepB/Spo0J family partition protein [Patescibacteria group bacterium]
MSQTPKRGLGRGFETLLPQTFDKALLLPNDDERIQKLNVDDVIADAEQPRRHFDEKALAELSESIRQHGVLLPLVVRSLGNKKYQIVAGERRWRASKLAGLKTVPAIVRSLKELQQLEIALVENVQRVDLSPLEQAVSLHRLHDQFSIAYEAIAKRLGKAPSTVNNLVRLLQLPEAAQAALAKHEISEGHARAILALKGQAKEQANLLAAILQHGWSVRQAERYVSSLKAGVKEPAAVRERVQTETPATKALAKQLGAPVHVKRTAKGGRLEITFKDDDELSKILAQLQ